jgi:hypothetical protein
MITIKDIVNELTDDAIDEVADAINRGICTDVSLSSDASNDPKVHKLVLAQLRSRLPNFIIELSGPYINWPYYACYTPKGVRKSKNSKYFIYKFTLNMESVKSL